VLQREAQAITCEVDSCGPDFEVCIVPHWDPAAAVIERFTAPTAALLRHADVARRLREDGWVMTDHVTARRGLPSAA
jgi:hypothetical protein